MSSVTLLACKHGTSDSDRRRSIAVLTSLSRQSGYLITHLIWIPGITQFEMLFCSWYIARRSRTLAIQSEHWTVAGTWSLKN